MAGGILDKMTSVFFQTEEEEDTLKPDEMDQMARNAEKNVWQEGDVKKAHRNQIMAIPSNVAESGYSPMKLVRVHSYDELHDMATHIKEHKSVIANMEDMDKMTAQRMVDYLCGAVFAMGGRVEQVSGSTFLFSSDKVGLEGQIMEQEVQSMIEQDATPVWRR